MMNGRRDDPEYIAFKERQDAARKGIFDKIIETLDAGGVVVIATYTKAWEYKAKHRDMFRFHNGSMYVQHGKRWDCIDGCGFRFFTPIKNGE